MFKDKNGVELHIGDYITPDEGLDLLITEEKYIDDLGEECLIATQVMHPDVFSILSQDNLSIRWNKIDNPQIIQSTSKQSTQVIEQSNNYYNSSDLLNISPFANNDEEDEELRKRMRRYG